MVIIENPLQKRHTSGPAMLVCELEGQWARSATRRAGVLRGEAQHKARRRTFSCDVHAKARNEPTMIGMLGNMDLRRICVCGER